MKRLDEKVKDIVEVRASAGVGDFLADPAKTLTGYHFTDITADLMAKWIDRIADVKRGHGSASALAGFRGVGKSHFLSALGAIVARPELRAGISDIHVVSKAHQLSRRHGTVVYVRRGSSDSLLSELKIAIAGMIGARTGELSDSLNDLLLLAANKSGEMPLVLFIDAASGRETRVARDDGALLSEIAHAAKLHGIFVGLALDDDIAGADGLNSSIASSFTIDYLDQEHLYKIVNAHIFTKHEPMRYVLHDIYRSYRDLVPGFRWSEHRFTSLYPLHPAILEIAPFIRLYLHDFALLGFAAEAGVKILGRPANSLIGLDEVFDSAEKHMRRVDELKDAFAAYDALAREVVAKAPVMRRHEAKLILKGLFLLSFNGEGASAKDLSGAMLIYDEGDPAAGAQNVARMLESFHAASPNSIKLSENPDRDTRFGFKLGREDDLESVVAEAAADVPMAAIDLILKRQTAEKFSDFDVSDDASPNGIACQVIWRGGIRHGMIKWMPADSDISVTPSDAGEWTVFVHPIRSGEPSNEDLEWPACVEWKPAELTSDDIDTIRRYHVLQTNTGIRDKFPEAISTAVHVHSIAVEKIWHRIFLEESHLISDGIGLAFTEEAISSHSLAQLLTVMLAEHFYRRYPSHPEFPSILGSKEVALLTGHLFSGSASDDPETQKLARDFAVPLGLGAENDGVCTPLAADQLAEQPIVKAIFHQVDIEDDEVMPLSELSARMAQPPYGLTPEAQHLVLTALVAQRRFEFVTSRGNRINHRSLDLQIIWDDIVGVARPVAEIYSTDRLFTWAALLTGDASIARSKPVGARLMLIDVLADWLGEWQTARLVEQVDLLPDHKLNSRLWRASQNVRKTYGVAAESIASLLQDSITLDQCLQAIAGAFCDSEDEFESKANDLLFLRMFFEGAAELDEIDKYLSFCEPTGDPATDNSRVTLMDSLAASYFDRDGAGVAQYKQQFAEFKTAYTDLFAERHDAAMHSGDARQRLDAFLSSDLWAMFSDLCEISWFGRHDMNRAMALICQLRSSECNADVRQVLESQPLCVCSFRMANGSDPVLLIEELRSTVEKGLDRFAQALFAENEQFSAALGELSLVYDETVCNDLQLFLDCKIFPPLSGQHMQILKAATEMLPEVSFEDTRRPASSAFRRLHAREVDELDVDLNGRQEIAGISR